MSIKIKSIIATGDFSVKNNSPEIANAISVLKIFLSEHLKSHLQKLDFDRNGEAYFSDSNSHLGKFVSTNNLGMEAQTIFLMALIPHIQPDFYDEIIKEVMPQGGDFPEFGGVRGANHRGMLPTGETVQFILAGNDIEKRISIQNYFSPNNFFYKNGILWLESMKEGEPVMSGKLILAPEWVEYLFTGKMPGPSFSPDFPAKLLTTRMEWKDLIIHPYTADLLNDIKNWIENYEKLYADERLSPKIRPGYRALFYGPPGTGKTLTASLLGKKYNKDVFRIDLSMVVSKYIGETEKNLSRVFDKAMNKDWILFFDEADALFTKRTGVSNAHDKYANQEVSYLLQRVEDFSGLLILASNFKSNIDDAFIRRFNSVIHFPKPEANDRLRIWSNCIPGQLELSDDVKLEQIASRYELTGAMIVNIMQYAAVKTFASKNNKITLQTLQDGIRKEFQKEEKSV